MVLGSTLDTGSIARYGVATKSQPHAIGSRLNHFVESVGDWRSGSGPLHRRLAAAIRGAIDRGDLTVGTSLPAERLIAELLGVSRGTVVTALKTLVDAGMVERVQGSGSVVRGRTNWRPGVTTPRRSSRLAQVYNQLEQGDIEMVAAAPLGSGAIPPDVWSHAVAQVERFTHGTGYFLAHGLPELRAAVSDHMAEWGLRASVDDIAICNGGQQGISLAVETLVGRGDHVIVEEFTWAGAIDALRSVGARIVSVPSDGAGPDVTRLREALATTRTALVYLCPTVNNPTGVTMSTTRRMRILEACKAHSVPIIDDCITHDLALGDRPLPLAAIDPAAQVITVGSLSKLAFAGLRIGWMTAQRELLVRLAERRRIADLGSPLVTQFVATELLTDHALRIRDERLAEIARRLDLVRELIPAELVDWEWVEPHGGYTIWLRMPHGDSREFAHYARREGVAVLPGTVVSAGHSGAEFVRLALVHDLTVTEEAFTRLGRAWRTYAPVAVHGDAIGTPVVV